MTKKQNDLSTGEIHDYFADRHPFLATLCIVAAILAACAIITGVISVCVRAASPPMTQSEKNKAMAHEIAEKMRAEGHPEDHPVILACQEWWRNEDAAEKYPQIEEIQPKTDFTTRFQHMEYPVAAVVWQLLRESGLSEVSSAAILGSMMAECGGQTLDLDPYIKTGGYFGLCMWSLHYFPEVDGLGVPDQVAFLLETLDSNLKVAGASRETFEAIEDVRAAARYFSDYYERPAVWAEIRATNAQTAYAYFAQTN